MMLILGKSDDVRRPRLVTACMGVNVKQSKAELQNSKTKAAMYILVKKSCSNYMDTSDIKFVSPCTVYIYFFLCHDLITLLNTLLQKFDRC